MTRPPTTGKVEIRTARPEEFSDWRELWSGYNAFYGRTGDTALPDELNELVWKRLHSPDEPMSLLVASHGKQLVGFAHLIFHRSTIATDLTCYLQDLFVAPESRRRGVAELLIAGAASEAQAAGCAKLYWQTHESNRTARNLYDRLATHRGYIVYDLRL